MSESIAEMILPGTYIEVRAEGLIGVGAIATGNIGIVGTAARGPRNEVRILSSYADAIDTFGPYDAFSSPAQASFPLTLVRALEQAFRGSGKTVYAVRVANGNPTAASLAITAGGGAAFTLTAADPGTWARGIAVTLVNEGTAGSPAWKLTLAYRQIKEIFTGADVTAVHGAVAQDSTLVTVEATPSNAGNPFDTIFPAQSLTGGNDRANVSSTDLAAGLATLEDQTINILLVAGVGAGVARGVVGAHLEATENESRDRIAVLGASSSSATDVSTDSDNLNDDRIVLVAPGLSATDAANGQQVALPPAYLAAVIAGKLSTLAPHISLTNKSVAIDDLDQHYNTGTYKNLLQSRVLLVRRNFGLQVVKGITTDTGAFKQISVRRIVDFAKAGVRSGSNPYIGRLNNARVRGAMKATLDGFLSQMVLDEMLVSYQLEVSATRAQEIRGIAVVTMTLRPTFSIDFIRVTMNLE